MRESAKKSARSTGSRSSQAAYLLAWGTFVSSLVDRAIFRPQANGSSSTRKPQRFFTEAFAFFGRGFRYRPSSAAAAFAVGPFFRGEWPLPVGGGPVLMVLLQ